jgi:hypothetical protein
MRHGVKCIQSSQCTLRWWLSTCTIVMTILVLQHAAQAGAKADQMTVFSNATPNLIKPADWPINPRLETYLPILSYEDCPRRKGGESSSSYLKRIVRTDMEIDLECVYAQFRTSTLENLARLGSRDALYLTAFHAKDDIKDICQSAFRTEMRHLGDKSYALANYSAALIAKDCGDKPELRTRLFESYKDLLFLEHKIDGILGINRFGEIISQPNPDSPLEEEK